MSESRTPEIDPRILGLRIQEARKARGLTQQTAAETLDLSRPTYIAIEKGERAVQPHELMRLAELYGRSVHDLLRNRPPIRDFVAHFRAAASRVDGDGAELNQAVALLQQLSENYRELEELCRAPLPRNYPAPYDITRRDAAEVAEEIAAAERNRLGLGDGPVPNLRDLLETDAGLRIFLLDLPSRIAGLFVFTEELGGCVAVQRKHPAGRRLWSLCHEYAHFLVHRFEAEVTVLRTDSHAAKKERLADVFAQSFLMPELGLRRRLHDLQRSTGPITPATLVTLADVYGVSFEALLLRLEDLRLIPVGTWHRLKENNFRVKEAQALMGMSPAPSEPMLPRRYIALAVRAYEAEQLSEGELVEMLHTDREHARRIVQQFRTRTAVTESGESGELRLDLTETLGSLKGGN